MPRYISPCEYGTCPSALMRSAFGEDAVKHAELMLACSNVLGKIISAKDFEVLIARDSSKAEGNEIVFAPSPCPLMTMYSLEVIEPEK